MSKIEKIEDIIVWQKSMEFAKEIYKLTNKGNFSKDYSIKYPIRRAAISVASNATEGFGRGGNKDFIQFLFISKGSLFELRTQLFYIALYLEYTTQNEFSELNNLVDQIGKLINGFLNYLQKSDLKGSTFKEMNPKQPIKN